MPYLNAGFDGPDGPTIDGNKEEEEEEEGG